MYGIVDNNEPYFINSSCLLNLNMHNKYKVTTQKYGNIQWYFHT